MDFIIEKLSERPYRIVETEHISTPRLVVFEDRVQYNIAVMRSQLKSVTPGFDMQHLCPHVKTHKSKWVTRMLMGEGVHMFKTTPNEATMLAEVGVKAMFVAYPLLPDSVLQIAGLMHAYPNVAYYIQLARPEHAAFVLSFANRFSGKWQYFIDLDVGMGRTGIPAEQAVAFYKEVGKQQAFVFAGLHAYDGHIHHATDGERQKEADKCMAELVKTIDNFKRQNVRVPKIVVGGTPAFMHDLKYLARENLETEIMLSPGTWIYFDSMCAQKMPGTFEPAAMILAQVMDQTGPNLYTLNLGHKRWAIDQGAIEHFSVPGMRAVKWSEEHTVVQVPRGTDLTIGDSVLIAPRHVCPTVNLFEFFTLVDKEGHVTTEKSPIDARNR